jgi:predicted Zn-dependent peptidase
LLADLICNSTFPERELEREKQVVIDEIYSYMDNPSEAILDDFEEAIFRGYPIGRKILGSAESVKGLTRSDILSFIERNYTADRMVLSSVGNIKFEKLVALAERFFNGVSSEASPIKRIAPINYEPVHVYNPDDLAQCYYMTGNRAFHQKDKERVALSLLVEMLGGNSMGSRLNLRLREKNGLVYEIESNYTPYSDSGVFSVYFACDSHNLERCIRLCHEEMSKLSEKSLTPSKLERFKAQYKAQMAIASENYEGSMLSNGKSLLVYDKVDELDRIYEKIDALTPNDLRNAAEKIFDPKKLSSVTYGV